MYMASCLSFMVFELSGVVDNEPEAWGLAGSKSDSNGLSVQAASFWLAP